jgi:hypothetical protein
MTTINELIKKYEEIIKTYYEWFRPNSKIKQFVCNEDELNCYKEILQDLKQLKKDVIKTRQSILHNNNEWSANEIEVLRSIDGIIGE